MPAPTGARQRRELALEIPSVRHRPGGSEDDAPPAFSAWLLVLSLAMALGSPPYRCGGRGGLRLDLRSDHPMLEELGIDRSCPQRTHRAGGWWPGESLPPG